MPGGSAANSQESNVPKTVRELAAFCSGLETTMRAELQGLKESTNLQLQELMDKVVSAPQATAATAAVQPLGGDAGFAQAVSDLQMKLDAQIAAVSDSLRKELDSVRIHLSRLDATAADQADQMDASEQYARRNCLLVHGLPEVPNEDPYKAIVYFAKDKLDFTLRLEDIDRCHCLGPPKRTTADAVVGGRPRPLIIKFARYIVRAEMWTIKKKLKNTGLLISESLTVKRSKLFTTIREVAGVGSVWTQDGRIVVMCPNGSRLAVTRERDLQLIKSIFKK